ALRLVAEGAFRGRRTADRTRLSGRVVRRTGRAWCPRAALVLIADVARAHPADDPGVERGIVGRTGRARDPRASLVLIAAVARPRARLAQVAGRSAAGPADAPVHAELARRRAAAGGGPVARTLVALLARLDDPIPARGARDGGRQGEHDRESKAGEPAGAIT